MYHFENILTSLIFIVAHFLLFFLNYELMKKKIMHPAVLFSLVWFIVVLLHFIFSFTILNELPPLRTSTYIVFFIGVIAFSFGAFIETLLWQKNHTIQTTATRTFADKDISLPLSIILLSISVIGLPFFLYKSYKIFIESNIDTFFIGLRSELLYGDEDIGALKYLFPFSLVLYAFILSSFLKDKKLINRVLLIISSLVTLAYAIFTTGRLIFLIILVVYLGMRFIYSNHFSIKKIFRFVIFFMILFIGLGIVYDKGGSTEDSISDNIKPAAQGTAIYMVASLNALDRKLNNQFNVNYNGNNSLRFFIKLGNELGMVKKAKVNDLIPPFIFTPYPTNVYTIYSSYIEDFGKFYAWFIMAFLGIIQAWLYNIATTTKSLRYSFYYAILLYPLLISFFADQYFTLVSFWLQFCFFVEAIILLNKIWGLRK